MKTSRQVNQSIMQSARAFAESNEFREAIASNAIAEQSGATYKVELLSGLRWRLLRQPPMSNVYLSTGKVVGLPLPNLENCETFDDFDKAVDLAAAENRSKWIESLEQELS